MARAEYTEEQIKEFMDLAEEKGIRPAMKELGYPGSHNTVTKWYESRGQSKPDVTSLHRRAKEIGDFYTQKEEPLVINSLMEELMDQIDSKNLNAEELNKIINAYQKLIQTKRLIEGKSTAVNETVTTDAADLEIMKLAQQFEKEINGQEMKK